MSDEWKTFEIRRGMIVHEDEQINHRTQFRLRNRPGITSRFRMM